MLRYGIPQYRLPKVEVLEAEYESVTRLGGKIVCNAGLGTRLHPRRPAEPGLRLGRRRHRLLRHQQAGHPRRGRGRGPRRPRVPAHRHARPALPGPRGQARRRHRRRLHLDGLLADVGPPGRQGGHPRLPPRHEGHAGGDEVHEAIEEGVTRHLPGRPDAGSSPTTTGNVTGVEFIRMQLGAPDASGRRRPEPAPGTEFIIPCDRVLLAIGQGPELTWIGAGLRGPGRPSSAGSRPTRSRSRPAGRASSGPATCASARRRSSQAIAEGRRAAYAVDAYLQGPGPGRHPDPPDAGRAAARVPLDRAVHDRGQGAALPA